MAKLQGWLVKSWAGGVNTTCRRGWERKKITTINTKITETITKTTYTDLSQLS